MTQMGADGGQGTEGRTTNAMRGCSAGDARNAAHDVMGFRRRSRTRIRRRPGVSIPIGEIQS